MIRMFLILLLTALHFNTAAAQQWKLDVLLSFVTEDHPRMRAAIAEIDVQLGRKLQAIAPPSPRLTFHEEEIPTGAALGAGEQRIWQLSQEFDLPLLIGARGYAYGHLQQAAEYRLAVARSMVRADIIESYAIWYTRLRQFVLLEENQRLASDFARKAQLRYETGESSALEAARARAEEASSGIALEQARINLEDAAAALSLATARDVPADAAVMPDSLDADKILRRLPFAAIPTVELTASPLLQAMREERDAARSNASWRWMEILPRFEASWFRQDFKHLGAHWGAELTASIPLWFFLDTRGSIKEHDAVARQAEAQYELSARELDNASRKVRRALESAAANIRAYNGELILEAQRIARAAELGYDSGEVGYMEYLSARQAVNAISIGYYDALAALYKGVAQYELVSGIHILE